MRIDIWGLGWGGCLSFQMGAPPFLEGIRAQTTPRCKVDHCTFILKKKSKKSVHGISRFFRFKKYPSPNLRIFPLHCNCYNWMRLLREAPDGGGVVTKFQAPPLDSERFYGLPDLPVTSEFFWGRVLKKIRKKSIQDFLRYEGKYESSICFRLKLQWLRNVLTIVI